MLTALGLYYAWFSALSFFLYAEDKRRAIARKSRTPENYLHFIDIVGGWPGGRLAQIFLRHKSRKPQYLIKYWVTVSVNVTTIAGLLYIFSE